MNQHTKYQLRIAHLEKENAELKEALKSIRAISRRIPGEKKKSFQERMQEELKKKRQED